MEDGEVCAINRQPQVLEKRFVRLLVTLMEKLKILQMIVKLVFVKVLEEEIIVDMINNLFITRK